MSDMSIHSCAILYHDTFTPILSVNVTEHAGTLKYRDKITGAIFTCFLQITTITFTLGMKYYPTLDIMVL